MVLSFCFTQVAPAGLAATNLNDLSKDQGVSATVDPLAEGAKKLAEESKLIKAPGTDTISFMLGGGGISNDVGASFSVVKEEKAVQDPITPRTPEELAATAAAKAATAVSDETVNLAEAVKDSVLKSDSGIIEGVLPESNPVQVSGQKVGVTITSTMTTTEIQPDPLPLPVIDRMPAATKSEIHVVTDPASNKALSVTIDEHGIATVKWGDEEYKGFYDARTNSLTLVTKNNDVWTLQFGKNDKGESYLQSFQKRNWSEYQYSEETYTYNPQGQLVRKDWLTESNYYYRILQEKSVPECYDCGNYGSYRSGGTIDYVTINGKTLVSHEKSWSENNGRIYYEYNLNETNASQVKGYPINHSETDTWYSYDGQGNLLAKNWNSTGSYGNSYGQEIYVHINGRDLVSIRRTWQYGPSGYGRVVKGDDPIVMPIHMTELKDLSLNEADVKNIDSAVSEFYFPYASSHSEEYYNYDSDGNQIGYVSIWEGVDFKGKGRTSASYSVYNAQAGTWESASAEGLNIYQIRSANDWKIIQSAAQRKNVYVGGAAGNQWSYTHRVEYTRNPDGSMTAKAVYDNEGNVSIVLREPDVLSGGTDDIKIKMGQQPNGQNVSYGETGHWDENGTWVSEGYRLTFSGYDANGAWSSTAVDFPTADTVVLNGVRYKITFNAEGVLNLEALNNPIPPAVQAYIDALKGQLGDRFSVAAVLQADGTYLVTVGRLSSCAGEGTACEESALPPGYFSLLEFRLTAEGALIRNSLKADYNGMNAEGKLLFEALEQLYPPPQLMPCAPGVDCKRFEFVNSAVFYAMTRLVVNGVDADGAIHFTMPDGKQFKAYRDADGKVIIGNEIPSAVQAYIDALKGTLGDRFSVTAELQNDGTYLVKVGRVSSCPPGAICEQMLLLGGFSSLQFRLTPEGVIRDSVKAFYNGMEVTGIILLNAMSALEGSFHPQGSAWMPPPETYIAGLVRLMTELVVKESGENLLRFDHDGKSYTWAPDENGNMKLTQDLTPEQKAIAAMKSAAQTGLMNTFGFSKAALDQLIKDGKIVITVDLEHLTATVTIDPSVTLPAGAVNLVDPLGQQALPQRITFQYAVGQIENVMCAPGFTCEPPTFYYLKSANYQIKGLSYQLSYIPAEGTVVSVPEVHFIGDNKLHSVDIYNETPDFVCVKAPCHELVETVTFIYPSSSTATSITLSITYHKPQGGVASRDVVLNVMEDGQYHIQTVTDKDAAGKVMATSQFSYLLSRMGGGHGPAGIGVSVSLANITRTDADGKALSEIAINGDKALITLSNGQTQEVPFHSIEGLLEQARQLEYNMPTPEVQKVVDALQAQLGHAYIVGAVRQGDSYLITVNFRTANCTSEACTGVIFIPQAGQLTTLSFVLSAGGQMDVSTLVVTFNIPGMVLSKEDLLNGKVPATMDARLLWSAMSKLVNHDGLSITPPAPGFEWMIPVRYLTMMTQLIVTAMDKDGAIHFTFESKNYKAYRDAAGNPKLAEEVAVSPEILAKAKGILGASVVRGVILVEVSSSSIVGTVEGAAVVSYFYNAAGEFMGTYTTSPSMGPQDKPTWRDANGNILRYVPPAAKALIDQLAALLGLSGDGKTNIGVVRSEQVTWSNGCLGFGLPGQMCTEALVNGSRVVLSLFGNEYEFHNGILDPVKKAAIEVIKHQVANGSALADIRILDAKIVEDGTDAGNWHFQVTLGGEKEGRNVITSISLVSPQYQVVNTLQQGELSVIAAHFGIAVEDIVAFQKIEPGMVCLGTGCPTWSYDVELTAMKNGKEVSLSGGVVGPAWGLVAPVLERPASPSITPDESKEKDSPFLTPYYSPISFRGFSGGVARRVPVGGSVQSTSFLRISAAPRVVANDMSYSIAMSRTARNSAIFGFERGNLLFGEAITEVTR